MTRAVQSGAATVHGAARPHRRRTALRVAERVLRGARRGPAPRPTGLGRRRLAAGFAAGSLCTVLSVPTDAPVALTAATGPVLGVGPVIEAPGSDPAATGAVWAEPAAGGIPANVLAAYQAAEGGLAADSPGCGLHWSLLAGIGRVESGHARGGRVDADGDTLSPILGPVLDGGPGIAAITDTDGGALDGDPLWDRAVGPMQFIPSTWSSYGADGDGNGLASPHNVHDAALAAGGYLCAGGGDVSTPIGAAAAVFRYNHSAEYVRSVLAFAAAYATGGEVGVPPSAGADVEAAVLAAVPVPQAPEETADPAAAGPAARAGVAVVPAPAPAAAPVEPAVPVPPVAAEPAAPQPAVDPTTGPAATSPASTSPASANPTSTSPSATTPATTTPVTTTPAPAPGAPARVVTAPTTSAAGAACPTPTPATSGVSPITTRPGSDPCDTTGAAR